MLKRYARLQREASDEKIVLTLLRAVKVSPEDVETRLVLGSHHLQKDSYWQAVAVLGKIRNANADQARSALRMLAFAHLKLNHRERGRQAARQLLDLAQTPDDTDYAQGLLEHLERDPAPVGDVQSVSQDGSRAETGERETRP